MAFIDFADEHYDKEESIDPTILHHLILDYLVHGCYSETTTAFMTDISPPIDNSMSDSIQLISPKPLQLSLKLTQSMTMSEPMKLLNDLVIAGNMDDVFIYIKRVFKDALDGSQPKTALIVFELQSQHFIELVKHNKILDAITFAQQMLDSMQSLDTSLMERLQDLVSLVAYANPFISPLSHYLNESRKAETAEKLQKYILEFLELPSKSALEVCCQQAVVVRESLFQESSKEKKTNKSHIYPAWTLDLYLNDS